MTVAILSLARVVPNSLNSWLHANFAPRRSRILLVVLAFILGVGGLTVLDSHDSEILQAMATKQRQLSRIEKLGQTDLWHQRREETDLARVRAEARLWEAETDGLAQANFQSWILEQANRASIGVGDIHTAIDSALASPLKLRHLTAQLAGRFEQDGFVKLLQAIAGHDRLVVVERLEIQVTPVPRFEMVVGTYLRPAPRAKKEASDAAHDPTARYRHRDGGRRCFRLCVGMVAG
jgi:hypothetical protein